MTRRVRNAAAAAGTCGLLAVTAGVSHAQEPASAHLRPTGCINEPVGSGNSVDSGNFVVYGNSVNSGNFTIVNDSVNSANLFKSGNISGGMQHIG